MKRDPTLPGLLDGVADTLARPPHDRPAAGGADCGFPFRRNGHIAAVHHALAARSDRQGHHEEAQHHLEEARAHRRRLWEEALRRNDCQPPPGRS